MDTKADVAERDIESLLSQLPVPFTVEWFDGELMGRIYLRGFLWGRWVCRNCNENCTTTDCQVILEERDQYTVDHETFLEALAKGLREVAQSERERLSLRNRQLRSLRRIVRS